MYEPDAIIPDAQLLSLDGRIICIDPGHGGSATGTTGIDGPGYPDEKDHNLDMGLRLRDLLASKGAVVHMTRQSDIDVSLQGRCDIANNNNAEIFVSIHCNSIGSETVTGTETFYWGVDASTYSVNGKRLAENVQSKLVGHLGSNDRGSKADLPYLGYHLYVLDNTVMPAILTEVGFMSNQTEFDLLNSEWYRQEAAQAMFEGIMVYFANLDPIISEPQFVRDGGFIEHTPSVIQASNGTFFLAYESGNPTWHFTINLTWSPDGATWFDQGAIVSTGGSYGNRHPTLIQRQDGDLQVVYLSDRGGTFEIFTSISSNGISWTEYGPLTLSGPAINPFIIQEEGGSFAMSYQRYGSALDGSYFATSNDGIAWSTIGSRVSTRALPRLMKASDGGDYLMTFQGGSSGDFEIRYKTSSNGLTWSSERVLTDTGNSHDSFPFEMENGTYMVHFCTSLGGGGYDLYRKWSADMLSWSDDELIDVGNFRFDTEPHAFQLPSNHTTLLAWGYESSGPVGGYEDVDIAIIWIEDYLNYLIPLNEGWNLVSFPLEVEDESLSGVLDSLGGQWDNIQMYDSVNEIWLSTSVTRPAQLNNIHLLNETVGFWINCTSPGLNLVVNGYAPAPSVIQLRAGWNLVGYPSFNEMSVSEALMGTGYTGIEGFSQSNPYRLDVLNGSSVMKPGNAYWIEVPTDATWIINW